MNIHASLGQTPQPRFLMCPPRHFAVTYSINPWMDPQAWADSGVALHDKAQLQWADLRRTLAAAGAAIETLEPAVGLPDLVFTANGAVILDRKVVLARFHHGERRDEEPLFAAAFASLQARGLIDEVLALPEGVTLEGAGDCICDARRGLFWMGCGFRSDPAAGPALERHFGVRCLALPLADPRFYHLDTAFCALHAVASSTIRRLSRRPRWRRSTRTLRRQSASRSTAPMPRALPPTRCASAARSFFQVAAPGCGADWRSGAIPSSKRRSMRFSAAAARPVA
jgi:hypothetical protein